MKNIITENEIRQIVKETLNSIVKENDRHRPGYWAERWAKQKAQKAAENGDEKQVKPKKPKKKDRHRPGYYREYNMKHPERLNRGYTKGYVGGCLDNGKINQEIGREIFPGVKIIGYDEIGRPVTNDDFYNHILHKNMEWHDDDWYEGMNDD
jgi:hypothetical protein